jgi:hypothetical protein
MRKRLAAACAAACLVAIAPSEPARAGATVDLLFIAVNGTPIAPTDTVTVHQAAGDLLTMALVMTNDEPISLAQFGVEFNRDDQELSAASASLWAGVALGSRGEAFQPMFVGLCPEDTGPRPCSNASPGFLWPFLGLLTLPAMERHAFLPAGSYQMGTVTWLTQDARTDGADILATIDRSVDGFGDATWALFDPTLHSASVLLNPEPATALLLGVGVLALAAARRARRR